MTPEMIQSWFLDEVRVSQDEEGNAEVLSIDEPDDCKWYCATCGLIATGTVEGHVHDGCPYPYPVRLDG